MNRGPGVGPGAQEMPPLLFYRAVPAAAAVVALVVARRPPLEDVDSWNE